MKGYACINRKFLPVLNEKFIDRDCCKSLNSQILMKISMKKISQFYSLKNLFLYCKLDILEYQKNISESFFDYNIYMNERNK